MLARFALLLLVCWTIKSTYRCFPMARLWFCFDHLDYKYVWLNVVLDVIDPGGELQSQTVKYGSPPPRLKRWARSKDLPTLTKGRARLDPDSLCARRFLH